MKTWTTVSPNSYDAPNPGTILVGFEVKVPANTKWAITVTLVPEAVSTKPVKKVLPLAKWKK
jgi:hypothetical protein